ncbi:MAG: hydrogenase expression/formation protein HypE [Planctomycetota bacterium]|nr:hydrogenase expression/formation protein HypE [Planctomycetota bacterium]
MSTPDRIEFPTCPVASFQHDRVMLAHGEGGRLMRRLLRERIAPAISRGNPAFSTDIIENDAATFPVNDGDMAITTDSYVVSPLFFPGGDIGSLAVFGTINDLAVSGADPLWLTLGLILEEGLPFELLDRILFSIGTAAKQCGVSIVAGDTKVVPKGVLDKIFINTTGIGRVRDNGSLGSHRLHEGDAILVSGPIGHHGIAVLAAREQLGLNPAPRSDCAPLHESCRCLHNALGRDLHAMRDATRGGVSAVLHEWSEASSHTMKLRESLVPIAPNIRGACELLGLDPLYVANEGTFVAAVSPSAVPRALEVLQNLDVSRHATIIGEVTKKQSAPVIVERLLGIWQPLDEPSGAPLPRIC